MIQALDKDQRAVENTAQDGALLDDASFMGLPPPATLLGERSTTPPFRIEFGRLTPDQLPPRARSSNGVARCPRLLVRRVRREAHARRADGAEAPGPHDRVGASPLVIGALTLVAFAKPAAAVTGFVLILFVCGLAVDWGSLSIINGICRSDSTTGRNAHKNAIFRNHVSRRASGRVPYLACHQCMSAWSRGASGIRTGRN